MSRWSSAGAVGSAFTSWSTGNWANFTTPLFPEAWTGSTILVVGAANSSNSNRLVEVALVAGAAASHLIPRASDIDWSWFAGVSTLGLSAGASAPEELVQEVIAAARERFQVTVEEVVVAEEAMRFKLPRELVVGA